MAEILILADDLTGAADAAAACCAQNFSATVLLHSPERSDRDWHLSDILSIDANTRCLSADAAAAATSQLVRICREHHALPPGRLLFKKLDSTLRGHFAAELAAILDALRAIAPAREKSSIVMAPALPAQGRTTFGGRQMLHGLPVNEADIPAQLAEAGLSCRIMGTATIRTDSTALQRAMLALSRTADVLLCDAETDDDLQRIAEASMVMRDRVLWAGSSGLATHLPHAAGITASTRTVQPIALAPGPALFVVGSLASVARHQADRLSAFSDVATFHLYTASLQGSLAPIAEALRSNRDVLLLLNEYERCSENDSDLLARALAQLVRRIAPLIGALVATGGETARALLDGLGIRRLRLLGEVEPGIPFSIADSWSRPLPVLTKAGAFGSPDALIHCRRFLHLLDRSSAFNGTPGPSVF